MSESLNNTFFCLNEIAQSQQKLSALREQLPKIYEQYTKYKGSGKTKEIEALVELQKAVKQIWEEFPPLIQCLSEYGDDTLKETAIRLFRALKRFDYLGVPSYTQLCRALQTFEESLPAQEKNIHPTSLGRLINRVKMGFFPTDLEHVEQLKRAVVFPDKLVNLIDPCCGEGTALAHFAAGTQAVTYGIEIDEVRRETAKSNLNRVGFGSFFHSRISMGAFQGLFLNPPYLSVLSEHGNRRLEKAFLADSMRLLQNGGLLIYIIPYYRATPDVCRVLCENFDNLRVYRFLGKEYQRFRQVVFLGTKTVRKEAFTTASRLSEYMLSPENIQPLDQLPKGAYELPEAQGSVQLFKGAVFNVSELALQLKKSSSLDVLFQSKALNEKKQQPLLPLNLSQIGLVGASGLMNGLVECDTPHVIKGTIIKKKKTYIDPADKTIREITSNKLVFNLLTPFGFQSLE